MVKMIVNQVSSQLDKLYTKDFHNALFPSGNVKVTDVINQVLPMVSLPTNTDLNHSLTTPTMTPQSITPEIASSAPEIETPPALSRKERRAQERVKERIERTNQRQKEKEQSRESVVDKARREMAKLSPAETDRIKRVLGM